MTDDPVCRAFGRQHITPAAGAAARAVFLACGGAPGWAHWTTRHGQHVRVVLATYAGQLDDWPDAPASALYQVAVDLGWQAPDPPAWVDLPAAVRAAHNAFRAIYLEMSAQVDEAERQEHRAGHPRRAAGAAEPATAGRRERRNAGTDVPAESKDPKIVLLTRDPSKRRPRGEAGKIAATVHDAREAMKQRDKERSGR